LTYGYFKYALLYLGFVVLSAIAGFRQWSKILTDYWAIALFVVAYFLAYLLLYSWYVPIVDDVRLVLAQFVPLMVTL